MSFGQAVQHKHLIMSLGGGGGITSLQSNSDQLHAAAQVSSAVRFSFGYALSKRYSIGGHYDRIGSVVHPVLDRIRFTSYLIEGSYRIHNGELASLEVALGGGIQLVTLRPEAVLLPFDSRGIAINGSIRYLHLINGTIGAFVALDHIHAFKSQVTFANDPIGLENGDPILIAWNSQRITGGMIVRF